MKRQLKLNATLQALALLAFAFPRSALSQNESATTFSEILKASVYRVEFDGTRASGPGVDWLVEEGSQSQYFLVGERHGLSEIPKICSSLYEGLAKVGYDYVALEFGPLAARYVMESLHKGGPSELKRFLSTSPGYETVAFLDWIEEAEMVSAMHAASQRQDFLWGLDQEFFRSFGLHVAFLKSHATRPQQVEAASDILQGIADDPGYFMNLPQADVEAFLELFAKEDSTAVQERIEALRISHYIYGPWAKPSRIAKAESNVVREEYMKANLLKYVRSIRTTTGSDPKVFLKFGGFHAAPQIDTRNGRITLGTFVESFAKIEGGSAFNLMMECYSGSRKSSGQDAGTEEHETFECGSMFGDIVASINPTTEIHPFSELLDKSQEVLLLDLRPLRLRMNEFEFLSDDARALIAGFDAYMAIPNTSEAATHELR
jgi:hypothetical protein